MTFDDKNSSPIDSRNAINSPIADQIRKNFTKEGSHSGSRSREKSPIFIKNSPKQSPNISPLKKKYIADSIIGSEEKISNFIFNNEIPGELSIKKESSHKSKKSSQKSINYEEVKKSNIFA